MDMNSREIIQNGKFPFAKLFPGGIMVKNLLSRVSTCLLFALFSLYAQNQLLDPSFENGGAPWQMNTSGGRSIVNTVAQSGTHSEQMILPGVAFPRAVWQTVTDTVIAGTSYDVSGWVQTDAVVNSTAQIMILWFNTVTPPNNQVPGGPGLIKIDTVGKLAGTHVWTILQATVTAPAATQTAQVYLECTAAAGSSGTAWFDNLSFRFHPPTPPTLISAVASDNNIEQIGFDADDYVLLTFDKAVNNITVTALNIDSIFPLSNGHSWLDGFGALGGAMWNPTFTKLLVTLSTTVSDPSIRVKDSISFTGGLGKVELTGTFDPPVAVRQSGNSSPADLFRVVKTSGSFYFSCPKRVRLQIIDIKGHCVADLGSGTTFTWDYKSGMQRVQAGFYFAQLTNDKNMVVGKKIFIP
jgi:hypothetical protein